MDTVTVKIDDLLRIMALADLHSDRATGADVAAYYRLHDIIAKDGLSRIRKLKAPSPNRNRPNAR